jgi:CubicO group peptidase (beta-lactamase class C family)
VTKRRYIPIAILLAVLTRYSCAAELPRAKPETVGMSAGKLEKVKSEVQKLVNDSKIAGAITIVARKGRIVHFEAHGMRDIEEKSPIAKDTIMRIYSMSKPITTVAAMILFEQGKLKLDDPVEKFIPEFKGLKVYDAKQPVATSRKMTVRDLMRHSSGLTYGIFGNSPVDQMYRKANILGSRDLAEMAGKLGKIPLDYQPGSKWQYSVSTDMLGYVVERASHHKLDAFMQKHIFNPLDMKDTAFFVPGPKVKRFASCYGPELRTKDSYRSSRYLTRPTNLSGGGGLVSTARDYMRFCQMLINKGELQGKRLLKSGTVEMMTKNQLPKDIYCWGVDGSGFGLGFQVVMKDWGLYGHVGEYNWDGAASTHFWISPKDELVGIALTQFMPFSKQLKDAVKPLIYEAIVK